VVGVGIVYDTGGLALKSREGMCGMKADMGGAAAMLGAFEAAVRLGTRATALHLVLCVAENAIGPAAFRNDDVLTGLSGRSVEINNSDAEGRLVLADGVAHCTALPPRLPGLAAGAQPDLVVDMATLTGAQMIATGKRHAAIVANLEAVEAAAVAAGRVSGDLVHALPFAPEVTTRAGPRAMPRPARAPRLTRAPLRPRAPSGLSCTARSLRLRSRA
jgi:probable aminopeptidase NPEPL1